MNAQWVRTLRLVLAAGVVAGVALLAGPGATTASAETADQGLTCHGSIAGTDVAGVNSEDASQAITVPQHSSVVVTMRSDQPMSGYTVDLAFGFRGWQVADGSTTGNQWTSTVKVDDYARFGVGLYRVTATSDGPSGSCTAAALVRVQGDPVPGTVAGDVGFVLAGLGVAGLAGAGVRAATGGDGGPATGGTGDGPTAAGEEIPVGILPPNDDWCFPMFVIALLMTVGMMATGVAAAGPAGAPGPRLPRARWRPRIAGGAIVSGIVGAIGVLVLLQEYGRVFPTGAVVVRALVAGVVVGVLVPSLLRIRPVRRHNRRAAARERAMREAV